MITPIELHNRQHKTGRGYKKQEMDMFLEEVFENYEKLYKENVELKDKISRLSDGVQQYKTMETALQKALVLAETTSKDTIESANSKASVIEKEAKLKADTIINNALAKSEEIKNQCILLLQQYNQFKAQYKQIALKQIELLDGDFYEIYSKDLIDAVNEASKSDKNTVSETETTVSGLDNITDELQKTAEEHTKTAEAQEESQKMTEEPQKTTEERQKTLEEIQKPAERLQKTVEVPQESAQRFQNTVEVPQESAERLQKTVEEPQKSAERLRKTVVGFQNPEAKSENMKADSVNTDTPAPARDVNTSGNSLANHIDRAIKIGSDMTENKDSATVRFHVKNNGEVNYDAKDNASPIADIRSDTKEFTPSETQAINRASQAVTNNGSGRTKEDSDDEINNSLRKLRSQLASDRKSPNNNSSFEFFDNE